MKQYILYLHGLEGKLSEEKRNVLLQFGYVSTPDIDYRKPKILLNLVEICKTADIIIGSSMGGYTGYFLSLIFDKPCLLFNPAFPYRPVNPDFSGVEIPKSKKADTTIVLGNKDLVIKFEDNSTYTKLQ
jgi:predicted esterase YcpF (UPF0227 family)